MSSIERFGPGEFLHINDPESEDENSQHAPVQESFLHLDDSEAEEETVQGAPAQEAPAQTGNQSAPLQPLVQQYRYQGNHPARGNEQLPAYSSELPVGERQLEGGEMLDAPRTARERALRAQQRAGSSVTPAALASTGNTDHASAESAPIAGPQIGEAGPGPATSAHRAGLQNRLRSRVLHPFNQQARTEMKLRAGIQRKDLAQVQHYLEKGGDPARVKNGGNNFHLLSHTDMGTQNGSAALDAMLTSLAPASQRQALLKQDANGDTPLHIAHFRLGQAERNAAAAPDGSPERLQHSNSEEGFRNVVHRMTGIAPDALSMTNVEGHTPEQMYATARSGEDQEFEQQRRLRQSGLG